MNTWNIGICHYSTPPVVGGVEEVIAQHAELFCRHGHRVKVVTGGGVPKTSTYEVEIIPLLSSQNEAVREAHHRIRIAEGDTKYLEDLTATIYEALLDAFQDTNLVLAHNLFTMAYNLPATLALHRLSDIAAFSMVSWNHDSAYFSPHYPNFYDRPPWLILKAFNPKVAYVCISEYRKNMFERLYDIQDQLTVIPNGIDPIAFLRLHPMTARYIREKRLLDASLLMVQPSRLHPRKNIAFAIEVVRALKDRGEDVRLLVTGAYDPHEVTSVDYYNRLREMVVDLQLEETVLFIGHHRFKDGRLFELDRTIIRDIYLLADILFLPSLREGFGLPLLEAGLTKLPIVCSRIPSFIELAENDVCLFDTADPPFAVAQKILEFTARLEPHRMFRRVISQYTWDFIYREKMFPFLQQVMRH